MHGNSVGRAPGLGACTEESRLGTHHTGRRENGPGMSALQAKGRWRPGRAALVAGGAAGAVALLLLVFSNLAAYPALEVADEGERPSAPLEKSIMDVIHGVEGAKESGSCAACMLKKCQHSSRCARGWHYTAPNGSEAKYCM